ncbi:MAG: folate-binding protein [Marinobacter sp.]|uniref:CAF17-like 4Fe-4S cluster assembly/insertion protein YgfZ n=1 Tax=Marinobacter sp. TaxID=50741 RepID=UPI00299CDBD6|nr:folate-binding protein [Marinobacter sp.]MDX1634038.1 folate-binding protein [Marinobacter sp.]
MSSAQQANARSPLAASGWTVIGDRQLVRVSGTGADKFLHGQFSQNLSDVTAAYSPRAAACNPKGRAYALVRLVRDGDDLLFDLSATMADETLAHLNKYRMLFRGTTMAVEPEARILGILGQELAESLCRGASQSLDRPGATAGIGRHRLVRTEDTAEGLARYELWQIGPLSGELEQVLSAAPELDLIDWRASEIAAGVPALTPETRDHFVPQMLNWQHLQGIHFKKGCYTGQEVIARMHFLGQLKKSLYRLGLDSADVPPQPGEPVHGGERNAGELVNAVRYEDGRVECLAVLRHDSADAELTVGASRARVLPLPYRVPERENRPAADT